MSRKREGVSETGPGEGTGGATILCHGLGSRSTERCPQGKSSSTLPALDVFDESLRDADNTSGLNSAHLF